MQLFSVFILKESNNVKVLRKFIVPVCVFLVFAGWVLRARREASIDAARLLFDATLLTALFLQVYKLPYKRPTPLRCCAYIFILLRCSGYAEFALSCINSLLHSDVGKGESLRSRCSEAMRLLSMIERGEWWSCTVATTFNTRRGRPDRIFLTHEQACEIVLIISILLLPMITNNLLSTSVYI